MLLEDGCLNQNHEITRSSGWNFVDFRDAPEPKKGAWFIIEPDSWWALSEYIDVKILGDRKSWKLIGSYKAHFDFFMFNQGFKKAGIPSLNQIIDLINNREKN